MLKGHFFRWLAIPLCVWMGLDELVALQRRRWLRRRPNSTPGH